MIRRVFAVASIVLLLSIAAIAIDDYNSEWRTWQRAYFTTLKAHENDGKLGISDRIGIELGMNINSYKVVTNPDRDADTCMVCHLNVNTPDWGQNLPVFQQNPLKGLMDSHKDVFILQETSFDQIGCTACHGGDPIALRAEKAHEFLRDNFSEIFESSLADLRAPEQMVRQRAIERIRWMTGNFFGYKFSDPVEKREESIKLAEEWWAMHKEIFVEAGFGERGSPFKTENLLAKPLQSNPAISATGETLSFVGSNTCIGCHANPHPGGSSYIPESNKDHVEKWYQDAFKTSINPEKYLREHPTLIKNLTPQAIEDPERREEISRLLREAALKGELPKPEQLQDLVDFMKSFDITCEACHGPGSLYVQMMMKGLALDYQGASSEAAELIKRARTLGLDNGRASLADSAIFKLIQSLAANAALTAPEQTTPEVPAEQPTTPETPAETPQTPATEEPAAEQPADQQAQIERGRELYASATCIACHSVDGNPGVGPTWLGLFGKTETMADGAQVTVDESYLLESVREPGAKLVQGFGNLMPPYGTSQLSDEDLAAITAYIKSLVP